MRSSIIKSQSKRVITRLNAFLTGTNASETRLNPSETRFKGLEPVPRGSNALGVVDYF